MEQTTVEMISLCGTDGQLQPLRFRVKDTSGEWIRVDIEEVVSRKQIPYVGVEAYIYVCRAIAYQRQLLVELKYDIRKHIWYVLGQYAGI